jgi:hypothetical protein
VTMCRQGAGPGFHSVKRVKLRHRNRSTAGRLLNGVRRSRRRPLWPCAAGMLRSSDPITSSCFFLAMRTRTAVESATDCGDCCEDFVASSIIWTQFWKAATAQARERTHESPTPGSALITRRSSVRIRPRYHSDETPRGFATSGRFPLGPRQEGGRHPLGPIARLGRARVRHRLRRCLVGQFLCAPHRPGAKPTDRLTLLSRRFNSTSRCTRRQVHRTGSGLCRC